MLNMKGRDGWICFELPLVVSCLRVKMSQCEGYSYNHQQVMV